MKGKQGLEWGGTGEGDVTPTLSNALAEPEAPTLGGSGRRRGRAGAAVRRLPSPRLGMGHVPGARGTRPPGVGVGVLIEDRHFQSPGRRLENMVSHQTACGVIVGQSLCLCDQQG